MKRERTNIAAERAAIGGLLSDAVRWAPVCRYHLGLPVEAFAGEGHGTLVGAMYEMMDDGRGDRINTLTVHEKLLALNQDLERDWLGYMGECLDALEIPEHAAYYLGLVREAYIFRRVQDVSRQIDAESQHVEKAEELLKAAPDRYIQIISDVVKETTNDQVMTEAITDWEDIKAGNREMAGLPTPWGRMNQYLSGLQPGLVVIGGRPSQGKTTIEDQLCVELAKRGTAVARSTLDMNRKILLQRAMCREAGVSLPKLNTAHASERQMEQVRDARERLAPLPMEINDTDRDVHAICTWARLQKKKNDIGLFTLDYIQLVQVSTAKRNWNENQEITYVSQTLKALAYELEIPVVVLSQLRRGSDGGESTPRMADLRGSGSIEQDASVIILSHKDKKAEERKDRRPQWLEIAKHQNGPTGSLEFWFRPSYFRFDEAPENFMETTEEREAEAEANWETGLETEDEVVGFE